MVKNLKIALQILNILAFLGTLAVNALANILPIAGRTTGELSDSYPNLFVPAGLTFSIWGLIYLLLGAFVVFQARDLFGGSGKATDLVQRIGWLFVLASVANMAWIFAWHHQRVALSLLIMVVLLLSLIALYLRLGVGIAATGTARKLLAHLPFSVYLGWITVATIANVTALLVHLGWNRFGLSEVFWTVLVVVVAAVITLLVLFLRRDSFYALVVVWAFAGILIKRTASANPEWPVVITAAVCGALMLIVALVRLPAWLRY
jgi:hypothetical protein